MNRYLRLIRRHDRKQRRLRKNYCHKGYHKLRISSISWKFGNERMIKVDYLRCLHCQYKFFSTKKDKKKYLSTKNRWDGSTKEMFSANLFSPSSDKPKDLRSSVGEDKRELSVRGKSRTVKP